MTWIRRSIRAPYRRRTAAAGFVLAALAMVAAGCGSSSLLGENTSASTVTQPATSAQSVTVPVDTVTTTATTVATTVAVPLDPSFDAIAARTAMTADARNVLARAEPALVDRTALASSCPLDIDLSVLGCYSSGRIAVLQVTDPSLDGMTETTTAHEMLHAAWGSLDRTERDRLVPLLQNAYAANTTPELAERIEAYRASDPTVVDNELHSILGTEVADVGPELEEYYRRWFTDRSAVVTLAVAAQSTFTSLRSQVEAIDVRLDELRAQIVAEEGTLDQDRVTLETRFAELEAIKANGRVDEYNAGVDPFNQEVGAYNDAVAAHQAVVDEHNALVGQRNDLAAAYSDLAAQIDTSAEVLPS